MRQFSNANMAISSVRKGCLRTSRATTAMPAPTKLAPTHMSHVPVAEAELDWAEVSDELTGTAVFDATGDVATMPSWDELVRGLWLPSNQTEANHHQASGLWDDAR